MHARSLVIVRLVALVAASFAMLLMGLRQGRASHLRHGQASLRHSQLPLAQQEDPLSTVANSPATTDADPVIQSTARISIPFGFDSRLPLMDDGATVLTFGPGACTAGEEISIAITLTQSLSGASATGQWSGTCSGAHQNWKKPLTVSSGPFFVSGDAQACGHATTRDDSGVTDTMNWCDDVSLVWTVFLPIIQKQ